MLDTPSRPVKAVVVYITVSGGQRTDEYAARFVQTYLAHPPLYEHSTIIVCNGGPPSDSTRYLCNLLPKVEFWERPNDPGWDISAYIEVAKSINSNQTMQVCFGESIHFHRAGWLRRLVEAWHAHGPGMYGAFASHTLRAHINTTGFAVGAEFLARAPYRFSERQDRYEFEHGENAFWRRLALDKVPTLLVTWDGIYHPQAWRYPVNVLWRGDQSNCLFYCQHTENYFHLPENRRRNWQKLIDAPFR